MVIRLPGIEEQKQIADLFIALDKVITNHTEKVDALQVQKKGLMQRLLTGEVRVKV